MAEKQAVDYGEGYTMIFLEKGKCSKKWNPPD